MMTACKAKQSGITLIELLVVATIMLAVMVVSVPVLKPMLQSQATSNAASVVSSYLNKARTRAMLTGRPCGVVIELWEGSQGTYSMINDLGTPLMAGDNGANYFQTFGAGLILRQVEVPPYYSGLLESSTVTVGQNWVDYPNSTSPVYREYSYYIDYSNDIFWSEYLAGEGTLSVQFDGVGPFYPIAKNGATYNIYTYRQYTANGKIETVWGHASLPRPDHLLTGEPHSFKVIRDVRPTMVAPVALPQGTVVDFQFSGIDDVCYQFNVNPNSTPKVTVMFRPDGSVDRVSGLFDSTTPDNITARANDNRTQIVGTELIPSGTIYLLIGRWERICALGETEDGISNLNDANNFWVSINSRTGTVSTNEVNAAIVANNLKDAITQSREFARQSKRNISTGGN